MVESENEDLKKRLSSSGGRSPPPVSQPSAGAGARPPPYSAGNRGQGVSEKRGVLMVISFSTTGNIHVHACTSAKSSPKYMYMYMCLYMLPSSVILFEYMYMNAYTMHFHLL